MKHILLIVALIAILFSQVTTVQAASLPVVTIDSPSEMIYGYRPYNITTVISNPYSYDLSYDMVIEIFYDGGTDNSTFPKHYDGEIYNNIGDRTSLRMFVRGTIPAGSSHTYIIETASGIWEGNYRLVSVYDQSGNIYDSRRITLTKGTGSPYGVIEIQDLNGDNKISRGEYVLLSYTLYAAEKGQFIVNPTTASRCSFEGLPGGSVSKPNSTYAKFTFYVRVSDTSKMGPCSLNSSFNMFRNPGAVFPMELKLKINK